MTIKIEGFDKFASLGKDNADAVVQSSTAAFKGFEEISKFAQATFARQVEQVDAAFKAFSSIKNPAELADLQGKLARESIEQAITDSRKFAELTQTTLTAALEPLNARISAFQSLAKSAA